MTHDARDNRTRATPTGLVLTVGPGGQLEGDDDRVLQAGADYLARLGGGVLQILAGTFTMRNALFVHNNLTVRGAGADTVLHKAASRVTPLTRETDWYEYAITVEDAAGFEPGCAIMLRGYSEAGGLKDVVRDTFVAVYCRYITLCRRPEKNFWRDARSTAATLPPHIPADEGGCYVRT